MYLHISIEIMASDSFSLRPIFVGCWPMRRNMDLIRKRNDTVLDKRYWWKLVGMTGLEPTARQIGQNAASLSPKPTYYFLSYFMSYLFYSYLISHPHRSFLSKERKLTTKIFCLIITLILLLPSPLVSLLLTFPAHYFQLYTISKSPLFS